MFHRNNFEEKIRGENTNEKGNENNRVLVHTTGALNRTNWMWAKSKGGIYRTSAGITTFRSTKKRGTIRKTESFDGY